MVNFANPYGDEHKKAKDVLEDLYQHPEKIAEDMFLELTDWEEEKNETLGYRLKKRQGVIGGVLDSRGDDVKLIVSFFRVYPLENGQDIPQSSVDHIHHVVRSELSKILRKYSQKYENIALATLQTPQWMQEEQDR